jgi:octanoyl-[GcvH]:protein N-octanoyltransferase
MPSSPFEVIVGAAPLDGTPADDHEVSRGLLRDVAADALAGALRVWRPVPALALTRVDELRAGADRAVAAGLDAGFPSVRRISGGHAVVLGPGSLCVGLAEPADAFSHIDDRYERFTAGLIGVLADMAIIAEHGELAGEWCPGAWSIHTGETKLAGISQRVIKGAAWTEAVIELRPDAAARRLLVDVYAALELALDPTTFGSVAEVAGRVIAFDTFASRLTHRFAPV